MPDVWKGYVSANDDVRHTYERVFYGRQLTDNNADYMPTAGQGPSAGGSVWGDGPTDTPGVTGSPSPVTSPTDGPTPSPTTSDLYGSVYGPSNSTEATVWGSGAASDVQPIQGGPAASPGSSYPQLEPPTIDVTPTPQVGGPSATNDMTPG